LTASAAQANAGREPVAAAVLVPLLMGAQAGAREPEPHLVLTRRRSDLRRHAGEISFPGGRMDGEDASLEQTALREAEEEIGLAREYVSVIGELPPTSTFATNYVIHPFVATIAGRMDWRLSATEVEAVLELPLSELRAGRTQTQLERRGITFTTDAFVVEGDVIWGATARIIENLLGRLRRDQPGGALALEPV
jgi:8-oxo-dGTP pyrophosphatase MutT (NUDIX family)